MESKYYTPEIDEFHYGFEYESLTNNKWIKKISLLEGPLSRAEPWSAHKDNFRVKCLDRKDIEDLGFKHIGALWFEDVELDCRIRKWKGLEIDIYVQWSRFDGTDSLAFRGSIKNKSELKKLLKQLNIT